MVRSGPMRDRVILQTQSETRNEFNEVVNEWTDTDTIWAEVRAVSGRERLLVNTEVANTDYLVRLRYRDDISPENRLVLADGTVLDIERTIPDQKRTTLEIMCVARSNA